MNASDIGDFFSTIISNVADSFHDNQGFVIPALITIAVILALVLIGKCISASFGKKKLLLEIKEKVNEIDKTVSSMDETVTGIDGSVNRLADKKTEVIYIDNHIVHPGQPQSDMDSIARKVERAEASQPAAETDQSASAPAKPMTEAEMPEPMAAEPISETMTETAAPEPMAAEPISETITETAAPEPMAAEPKQPETEEKAEISKDGIPFRRFSGRDCGVSKNGTSYTIEQLEGQIKE